MKQELFEIVGKACLLFVLCASSMVVHATEERRLLINDFSGMNIRVSDPEAVDTKVLDSGLRISFSCAVNRVRSVHIPLKYNVESQKVRLKFGTVDSVPFMGKYQTYPDGSVYPGVWEGNFLIYQKGPVQFSLDSGYHEDLVLWFKCDRSTPNVSGVIEIKQIEILPLEFIDDRDFVYILGCLIVIAFLLPGFLVFSVLCPDSSKVKLLALITPFSIGFFLILYAILYGSFQWSLPSANTLFSAYLGLIALLLIRLWSVGRMSALVTNFRSMWLELLCVLIVMLAVAAIVTKDHDLTLHTLTYLQYRPLTFNSFGAHDPMFPFVNGVAIFHNEPFSKYYSDARLLYEVQDRGVLAGVLYAVMRGLGSAVHSSIGFSYGFYSLFGSALNALVLLPLFALYRYFSTGHVRPLLMLFLVSASPFLVSNYLLTWFKMAGAGLIISGIAILLLDKMRMRAWVAAGIIWGLASSFHPSLALTLPIVTLWLIYRFWRSHQRRLLPAVGAFAALLSAFVIVNVPWAATKAEYFQDTNKLFREHFLASERYDKDGGIVGTISNFMERIPLEEQLSTRYERILKSFRIDEVDEIYQTADAGEWEEAMHAWNRHEAAYAFYVWLILAVLFLLSRFLTLILPFTAWSSPMIRNSSEFNQLIVVQVLSIVLVLYLSFGKYSPDLTWNLPMSARVVVLYQLVHANLAVGKIGAGLIVVYSALTYYRMFFHYF